jgi:hypothetical protein
MSVQSKFSIDLPEIGARFATQETPVKPTERQLGHGVALTFHVAVQLVF